MAEDPYAFTLSANITIEGTADVTYDLVSDVTRFGSWSTECTGGEWVDERRGDGARFLGHNRSGEWTWTTECEVLVAQPPTEFAWHVLTNTVPYTSVWRFRISTLGGGNGVRLLEEFEMLATPHPFRRRLDGAAAERRPAILEERKTLVLDGMQATLAGIKQEAESRG